jgi:glyoxylase-like metal-dependent hydrolase (beta-lactamase superfamily II)
MQMNSPLVAAAAALLVLAALPALAQPAAPQPSAQPPAQQIQIEPIRDNVYWAPGEGRNGNSGVIVGKTGVIVIDVMASETAGRDLLAQVAKLTPKPLAAVILTGAAGEAIQGLAAVPRDVPVIGHESTARRLKAWIDGHARFAPPGGRLPTELIHGPRSTRTLDGVKLEFLHLAPAHTDTEMAVYLPRQRVVFAGWVVQAKPDFPIIHGKDGGGDFNWGGSALGWITFTKGLLALDADTYVLGQGDLWTKADLKRRLDAQEAVVAQIRQLVAAGKSHDEIRAALGPAATLNGRHFDFMFSEIAYDEITGAKR